MPAFAYEYELTKADGIAWEFSAAPTRVVSSNGAASGVEFARTRLVGSGRQAKLEATDEKFVLPADMVIKALGQEPLAELMAALPGLKVERGRVTIDRKTGATSIPRLFSGGDCTSKGAEVVDAVQEGKIAAGGMHAMLSASR